MNSNGELIELTPRGDRHGWLVAVESLKNIPFDIRRIYYIFGTQAGVTRGKHAHRGLRQMAICLRGHCRFLMDDGATRREYRLERNTLGLLIEPMVWHEMDEFSEDCVLLVLASDHYDEADYIRDYSIFAAMVARQSN